MLNTLTNALRQVSTPAFALEMGNLDITNNIAPRLISLTVTDNRGFESDELTLTLDDSDGLIQLPERGAEVRLAIGEQGYALYGMGEFTVDEITHQGTPDQVVVTARSADFRATLNSPQETSWHDITLGAIVEKIAERNKLTASVATSLAQIHIAHIDQSHESDASFLQRLALRNGAELAVKWKRLLFIKPGQSVDAKGQPISQLTLHRSDGDRHNFTIADRLNYSGVTARWLETKTPQKQKQKIQLQSKPAEQNNYTAGDEKNVYAMTTIFASEEEAKIAANALWSDIQRNAATFTITLARGRADITPETPVRVRGFKEAINEKTWVIKKITHVLDNKGFISRLDLEVKIDETQYDAHIG